MSHTIPTTPAKKSGASPRIPPGPRSLSPFGSASAMARDTSTFALDIWQRYGDIVRIRFLFWPGYVLYHPDSVNYVLRDHHRNYDKHFPMMASVKPLFGNGLFTNDGESWLQSSPYLGTDSSLMMASHGFISGGSCNHPSIISGSRTLERP